MDKETLEIVKELRGETGISIAICSEAAKECKGDRLLARTLLRGKCCEVGKKFYKNKERPLQHSLVFFQQDNNLFKVIKLMSESEFLVNDIHLKKFIQTLMDKGEDLLKFIKEQHAYVEEEILYLCGMLRENIQLIAYNLVKKDEEHHFIFNTKGTTPNADVVNGINILVTTGVLEEDTRRNVLINANALTNKKINNISNEKNAIVNHMYEISDEELKAFLSSSSVNNKEIKVSDLMKSIEIKHLIAF